MQVWGVRNDVLGVELVEEGFVSLGWDVLGDLRRIPDGREGIKAALALSDPEANARSIAGQAGVLIRFRDDMQIGDVVVAPFKPDSTINLGIVTGDYYYAADASFHRHRRRVEWRKTGLPRAIFTQPALYEIGSALSVFGIRKHAGEFIAALDTDVEAVEQSALAVAEVDNAVADDDVSAIPVAAQIDRRTRDFILKQLHQEVSHRGFEEFTADLLRAVGYQARVTQYSQDGGVDVIAHRDPLGVEPPQIKIQCKHLVGSIGAPAVQQLVGSQGQGDMAVFVTLGSYTREALAIERQRPGLRLLNGEDIVSLVIEHYEALPERWRRVIPLTRILVVADPVS